MMEKLVCLQDYEDYALQVLPKSAVGFYRGGADQEQTLRDNRDAFNRWRLMPRMLRGVQQRSIAPSTAFWDDTVIAAPFGIAPTGLQKMAHEQGECATARAAEAEGIVYIMSTGADCTIEEVTKAAPKGVKWLQLYIYKDRETSIDKIRQAEKAGFKAVVVTVDTPRLGNRLALKRNESRIMKMGDQEIPLSSYVDKMFDTNLTWNDIVWLKSITSLPILVKGILRADDAELAIHHGVSGIIVSNHGGRQLDGVLASIDALPAITKQVNGRCRVYVDGGITRGTDILKALALGADMVFIGRPILWGLAHSGEAGVRNVIQLLKKEFDLAMALAGCSCIGDVDRSIVTRQDSPSSTL